ncbi:MAG: ATP-binding protein [Bdellovibrionota bacterium]
MSKITRLFSFPNDSFFLFGARGSGKSFLLKHQFHNKAHWINLLDQQKYLEYSASPERFFQEISALDSGSWVVVDEIQRIPSLLNYVHMLIEDKKLRFVLLGSSARKLRREGINLLGGRAYSKKMFPFLPQELGENFNFDRALEYGLLPLVYFDADPVMRLQAYVEKYLTEEIEAEALARNIGGFSRFLHIAARFHAQTINLSNIAREAEVKRPTASGYFEILKDTLIATELYPFSSKNKVRSVQKPKFYFVDSGLVRGIQKRQHLKISDSEKGPLFEGLIYHILCAWKEYRPMFFDSIYYWKSHSSKQQEVDFILEKDKDLIAIEVKAKDKIFKKDLNGLKAFSNLHPVKEKKIIYLGKEKQKIEDIDILPFQDWLGDLTP